MCDRAYWDDSYYFDEVTDSFEEQGQQCPDEITDKYEDDIRSISEEGERVKSEMPSLEKGTSSDELSLQRMARAV